MSEESLDYWIDRLNHGDPEAIERVFVAYEPYLRIAVRRRLNRRLRPKVDSADIVQSVFADVVGGIRDGGWQFDGRAQLQAFLRRIAWRRLADRCKKHAPALEREQPLADMPPARVPASDQPRPSQVAQGREYWETVLRSCPPAHHEIVRLRATGYRLGEIAARTGLHEGSVRRILYDLARRLSVERRLPLDAPGEGE
jgi:RNA polymerase sigma-70 factor (ECF subfamily)